MSASLDLLGVDYKRLVEDYSGYFKNSQEVSVEELEHLYYEILYDKVDDGVNCGLELFFGNSIGRYCFTIHEMMTYFFSSFNWNNEVELGRHPDGPHYILTKSQVIGLIDWYIALTYVFSDDDYLISKIKEPKYLDEAKRMIDYYDDPNVENYFKISGYDFVELKEKVVNAHYEFYFYTYSF
jgi:hypothetical protein